jgi:hypothetical protein
MQKIYPIDQWLSENLFMPRLPKPLGLGPSELQNLRTIQWQEIKFTELDTVNNFIPIEVQIQSKPELTLGISLWIQLVEDTFYQPHIYLTQELQGLGITYKIFRALLEEFGHIYMSRGRTLERGAMDAIIQKLAHDRSIALFGRRRDQLLVHLSAPDFRELVDLFGPRK